MLYLKKTHLKNIFLIILLLIIALVFIFIKNERKEPIQPSVKTVVKNIQVLKGFSSYKKTGFMANEKYVGGTIIRKLTEIEPTILSNKDAKIKIELDKKVKPLYYEILHVKGEYDEKENDWSYPEDPVIIKTDYKELHTMELPTEDGRYMYIIRYVYEEGYADFGFIVEMKKTS